MTIITLKIAACSHVAYINKPT